MKIRWLGHSCFSITNAEGRTLITDPYDERVGYELPRVPADVVTVSHAHGDHSHTEGLDGTFTVLDKAGATEHSGFRVTAFPSFHDDQAGRLRGDNLVFLIECDDLRIVHMGDLGHMLDDAYVDLLGHVDVLMVPVGGYYTIDAATAAALVAAIKPRITIPMHYLNHRLRYPITTEQPFLALVGNCQDVPNQIEVTTDNIANYAPVVRFPVP